MHLRGEAAEQAEQGSLGAYEKLQASPGVIEQGGGGGVKAGPLPPAPSTQPATPPAPHLEAHTVELVTEE
jgi:hypothetical protein